MNMLMEHSNHFSVICGTCIFKSKRHKFPTKITPRGCESSFMLVTMIDQNWIITKKKPSINDNIS